ncbi:mitochondrial F1F0 ATP synthase associated 13.3 kDa protein [Haematococcus lacustris]
MLRVAASRGSGLVNLLQAGASRAVSTSSAAQEGSSSIAGLISAVKASNASTFTSGGLSALKASIQPCYAAPAGASEGMSTTLKVAIGAAGVWVAYRANVQARSHDWIVDLSLDVLQAAWWITFASFIPFRSVVLSLRGLSPHTATPLNALKPVLNFK